jgi:hypothetical protein
MVPHATTPPTSDAMTRAGAFEAANAPIHVKCETQRIHIDAMVINSGLPTLVRTAGTSLASLLVNKITNNPKTNTKKPPTKLTIVLMLFPVTFIVGVVLGFLSMALS